MTVDELEEQLELVTLLDTDAQVARDKRARQVVARAGLGQALADFLERLEWQRALDLEEFATSALVALK